MSLQQREDFPFIEEGDPNITIGLYKDPRTRIKVRTAFITTGTAEYHTNVYGAAQTTGMPNYFWVAARATSPTEAVKDFQAWINFARFPAELIETGIASEYRHEGVDFHKTAPELFDEQGRPIAAALESLYRREESRYAEESQGTSYGQAEMAAALVKARGNVNAASRLLSKD